MSFFSSPEILLAAEEDVEHPSAQFGCLELIRYHRFSGMIYSSCDLINLIITTRTELLDKWAKLQRSPTDYRDNFVDLGRSSKLVCEPQTRSLLTAEPCLGQQGYESLCSKALLWRGLFAIIQLSDVSIKAGLKLYSEEGHLEWACFHVMPKILSIRNV